MGSNALALGIQPPPPPQGPLQMAEGGLNVQRLLNAVQLQKQQQAQDAIAQQSSQIQLEQQKQAQQDQQTVRDLAPQFAGKDANGNGTFDYDGLGQAALARGRKRRGGQGGKIRELARDHALHQGRRALRPAQIEAPASRQGLCNRVRGADRPDLRLRDGSKNHDARVA